MCKHCQFLFWGLGLSGFVLYVVSEYFFCGLQFLKFSFFWYGICSYFIYFIAEQRGVYLVTLELLLAFPFSVLLAYQISLPCCYPRNNILSPSLVVCLYYCTIYPNVKKVCVCVCVCVRARARARVYYRISDRKPKGKRLLGRPRYGWEDNIRIDLRGKRMGSCRLDASGLE